MNDQPAVKVASFIDVPVGEATVNVALFDVDSSQISRAGYDPLTETLLIQFKPWAKRGESEGTVYAYANVKPDLYREFRESESKGNFFGGRIKKSPDLYPYRVVKPAVKAMSDEDFGKAVGAMAGLR